MANDALHYIFITNELQSMLGSRIDKVLSPCNTDILLVARVGNSNINLIISAHPQYSRLHISTAKYPKSTTTNFCAHLKRHIAGGIIQSIDCVQSERIIRLTIECCDEIGIKSQKTLVCELMGRRSNIILVNSDGNISDCLYKASIDVSSRPMLPHLKYSYPPASNTDYISTLKHNIALARKIEPSPCIVIDNDGNYIDFCFCGDIATFGSIKAMDRTYTTQSYPTLNIAIDKYFANKLASDALTVAKGRLRSALNAHIKKTNKSIAEIEAQIDKSKDYEQCKLYGELLTAYMYKLKYGDSSITCLNYYDNTDITIRLDNKKNPAQNAQQYFKLYNKKQRTVAMSSPKLHKLRDTVEYHTSLMTLIDNAVSQDQIDSITEELIASQIIVTHNKKQAEQVSSPRSLTVDGYSVLIGKNNIQNDMLVRKSASTDIWLHASQIHGCHAVIKPQDRTKPIPLETIYKVAQIVAYYSKGKSSDKIPVDYCPIKNVSKPRGSVAGKVVYVNQKTIWATPSPIADNN